MERAFTKEHILELYLNEIFLGNRSYGAAAAALNYFDKSLDELTIARDGAARGAAQGTRRPTTRAATPRPQCSAATTSSGAWSRTATSRAAEADAARAEPITLQPPAPPDTANADFFIEEVRRQLVARLGEEGFYGGGLSVRVTVSSTLQALADRALRHGLSAFDRKQGWRGPAGSMDAAEVGGDWAARLRTFDPGFELGAWRRGMVLARQRGRGRGRPRDRRRGAAERGRPCLDEGTAAREPATSC